MQTKWSRHQSEKEKQAEETFEVIQDQTFNWTKKKISKWSITHPLKYAYFDDAKSHSPKQSRYFQKLN